MIFGNNKFLKEVPSPSEGVAKSGRAVLLRYPPSRGGLGWGWGTFQFDPFSILSMNLPISVGGSFSSRRDVRCGTVVSRAKTPSHSFGSWFVWGKSVCETVVIALLLFFCTNLSAATEPASPTWTVKQLMESLGQVKTAKATFIERKYLSILSRPIESSGTLIYTAPDRLEKHTLLPKPESMILERDNVTFENKAKNQRRTLQLQSYPVIWAFVESIRSTLAGDLQTLNRFYRVKLEGNPAQWRLFLEPSEQVMKNVVSEIRISGSKNQISNIEIIEAEGDRSVMTITESNS